MTSLRNVAARSLSSADGTTVGCADNYRGVLVRWFVIAGWWPVFRVFSGFLVLLIFACL